jgi:spore germination protein
MGHDVPAMLASERPPPAVAGRHRHRQPRRRRPARLAAAGAAILAAVAAAAALLVLHPSPAAPGRATVASLPYWSIGNGTGVVLAHRQAFTEASPWMYGLTASGQINVQYSPGQAAAVTADIQRLRDAGLRIVPTVANITNGNWAYPPVARLLHNPALLRQHIAALVALATRHGYAGIDIDYEDLHAADRQAFTTFITQLAAALHAHGKILSVAVFAKTTNAGYAPRNVAQDYAALGRAADQVRVMAYDYHWASSGPGPIAPAGWVRGVLGYARSQIPASKIILGIPLYGYDWTGNHGAVVTQQQALRLAAQHAVAVRYDRASQSPWFAYTAPGGSRHQVWFEDPASTSAKLALARAAGVGGVFCWMYGDEAPGTWPALSQGGPAGGQAAPNPGRTA